MFLILLQMCHLLQNIHSNVLKSQVPLFVGWFEKSGPNRDCFLRTSQSDFAPVRWLVSSAQTSLDEFRSRLEVGMGVMVASIHKGVIQRNFGFISFICPGI